MMFDLLTQGMFLRVHLIIRMMHDQWSVTDLVATVDRLPKGLNGV
jgi:hypothetical protein